MAPKAHELDLAKLAAFELVARNGTLQVAAARLNRTVSAISTQIKHLEEDLGVELFRRTPNKLTITPEGNTGSYFALQNRNSDRYAWLSTYSSIQVAAGKMQFGWDRSTYEMVASGSDKRRMSPARPSTSTSHYIPNSKPPSPRPHRDIWPSSLQSSGARLLQPGSATGSATNRQS